MQSAVKDLMSELRDRLENLYAEQLDRMILFGSQARGDFKSDSDIDVLVVLKGLVDTSEERERTLDIVADLSLKHDVVICCIFMDLDTFLTRRNSFLKNIHREGVMV